MKSEVKGKLTLSDPQGIVVGCWKIYDERELTEDEIESLDGGDEQTVVFNPENKHSLQLDTIQGDIAWLFNQT